MAQSLVCNDCGLQLKSVKEATDHNEATGHANFAESEEKVGTPSFRVQKLPKLPIPDKPELAHAPSPCCAGCQHGVRGVRKALQKQDAAGSALQTHWPCQVCRQGRTTPFSLIQPQNSDQGHSACSTGMAHLRPDVHVHGCRQTRQRRPWTQKPR